MAEERRENEMDFGEAFAQAAGLPMPRGGGTPGEPARPDALDGEPGLENSGNGPEDGQREGLTMVQGREPAVELSAEEAQADESAYRQLYERERQRLRSFQGRYRKDKERWLAERNALLEELAHAGSEVGADSGQSGETGEAGQVRQHGERDVSAQSARSAQPGRRGQSGTSDDPGLTNAAGGAAFSAEAGLPSADGLLAGHPELAQAVCAMVRAKVEELAGPVLASLEIERHVRRIAAAHPDWEELAAGPEISEWIEAQPAYLAASLRRVVENGGADEVIDLLDRFKREQGRPSASEQAARGQARRERDAERAAAVPSRSAGPAKGRPDKADFRSAWSEAASAR